jgi:hypothetical protein
MNKTNLLVDFGILATFLVAFEPGLTGLPLHEWLGAAFAATILIHLLLHWKWILAVGGHFFKKLFHNSRLQFAVDALLFIAFILAMVSGFAVSRTVLPLLGIRLAASGLWRPIHSLSANGTLALVGLHFALHWSWVVTMTKRYLLAPLGSLIHRDAPQPAALPVEISKQS